LTDQRTDAWIEARKGKITASVAAGCLGLCPYTSRQEAWRRILGTSANGSNRHMAWGVEFEAKARETYECLTGNLVEETGFWVHPSIPWLGASPDGFIGFDGMLEVKCPSHCPDNGMVPIHHRIQMLVQMACTGRQWCDYFVWTHEATFLRRVFPAGTDGIIRRLEAFYQTYVLTKAEPPRKKRKSKPKE
jgi:putative phage-type endonuclease